MTNIMLLAQNHPHELTFARVNHLMPACTFVYYVRMCGTASEICWDLMTCALLLNSSAQT